MNKVNVNHYILVDYWDVWKNEEDGWRKKNFYKIDYDICITENATGEEIIEYLKSIGYLSNKASIDNIRVEDCGSFIELFQIEDEKPLGMLERVEVEKC